MLHSETTSQWCCLICSDDSIEQNGRWYIGRIFGVNEEERKKDCLIRKNYPKHSQDKIWSRKLVKI